MELDRVFVQHPISDQTTEQLSKKADDVMEFIFQGLISNSPVSKISNVEAVLEEEECAAWG